MSWELELLHWFETIHTPLLDAFMKAVTLLGNAGIFWILLTVVLLCTKRYRRCGIAMSFALILSLIFTNGLLKNLIMRPRPFWIDTSFNLIVAAPSDYSFPSGHSSASFAAAMACFMLKKRTGAILLCLAALISLSRLYLTVHYPTDILAGMLLGIIYGIAGSLIVKRIFLKRDVINTDQT